MHGRHQAVTDAERLVQHLRHGRQAVGRAGGVGDDVVALGSYTSSKLTPSTTVASAVASLGRRGDDHLARACLEVLARRRARAEATRRLDHDVHAELAPREGGRVRSAKHADLVAVDADRPSRTSTLPGKAAVDGVVAQQARERRDVRDVVDRDHSMSAPRSRMSAGSARPMRPKPLMATLTGMTLLGSRERSPPCATPRPPTARTTCLRRVVHRRGRPRQAGAMEESIDFGSPPCSPQIPTSISGRAGAAALDPHADERPDAVLVDRP